MKLYIKLLRNHHALLSSINKEWAASSAFKLMCTPRKIKFKTKEKEFYSVARKSQVPSEVGMIPCYEVGNISGPLVLLVHGWESNAGSMSGVGNVLAEMGYRVVSFDSPAHGNQQSKRTTMADWLVAMEAVIEKLNPSQPFSIVGHSFGSAASVMLLSKHNYPIDRLLLLSSPNKLLNFFEPFRKAIDVKPEVYRIILDKVEGILGESLDTLRVDYKIKEVSASYFGIVHDKFDKVLDFNNAELIVAASNQGELIPIEKAGHYRMLWNENVLELVKERFASNRPEMSLTEKALAPMEG